MQDDTIDRRTFIGRTAAGTAAMLALAGCADSGETDDGTDPGDTDTGTEDDIEAVPDFVEVEDPPDAVYVPTHMESMRMLEPIEAGDVALAPMLSYPHPFWIVAGTDEQSVQREDPEEGRGVHLMFTLWDRETGVVLPVDDGAEIRLERDGDPVGTPLSPWTMISQEMGFHFGDNVALPEDGTYTVEVTLPPLSTRTTGDLEDRFQEPETASFEFVYDDEFRHEVVGGVEWLDEADWGRQGALPPMDHGGYDDHHEGHHDDHHEGHHDDHHEGHHDDHHEGHHDDHHEGHHDVPYSALPDVDEYPGTLLLEADDGDSGVPESTYDLPSSGDARFLVTVLESGHRLAGGDDEEYLLVSPRTPYNRVPLADMSLDVIVERDGEEIAETALEQTLDGTYDHHYGATVPSTEAGDSVEIVVRSPPQVARHQGYETAFLEMPSVELVVPEGG
ncbi:DUF7350 domain-containing protein [Natrarchaeobaculum aegyptiacum]|uniref:DUF7350 domain-containing protein n=1 Tax=Natrarchaeobaculum aegyptiacum TaxID=745377 RepID=A0A2Z2I1A7_9EURY|nr:hypothetical protein [Natrarchaeobaculum aegyptiacum]ARS91534.1 hypothetical protein B1756_18615 [Natrarchaeobaculum aegyptiacum]